MVSYPDASADTDPETLSRFLAAAYRDLSDVLPSYTSLHVATRRDSTGFSGQRLHKVADPTVEIELWAQDVGEPVLVDGEERFLVSKRMPPAMGPASKMSADRTRVAEIVFGADSIVEAPFVFEGGNVAFDRGLALIGRNDVSRTLAAFGDSLSRRQVLEDVPAAFGAEEAVEMGRRRLRVRCSAGAYGSTSCHAERYSTSRCASPEIAMINPIIRRLDPENGMFHSDARTP